MSLLLLLLPQLRYCLFPCWCLMPSFYPGSWRPCYCHTSCCGYCRSSCCGPPACPACLLPTCPALHACMPSHLPALPACLTACLPCLPACLPTCLPPPACLTSPPARPFLPPLLRPPPPQGLPLLQALRCCEVMGWDMDTQLQPFTCRAALQQHRQLLGHTLQGLMLAAIRAAASLTAVMSGQVQGGQSGGHGSHALVAVPEEQRQALCGALHCRSLQVREGVGSRPSWVGGWVGWGAAAAATASADPTDALLPVK